MRLALQANCSVENAENLRGVLLGALNQAEPVELDFSAVEQADMSFFQLLVAARRSFERAGKSLGFTATLAPELAKRGTFMGFAFLAAAAKEEQA